MASVKVAVRVRPFNQREIDMGAKLIVQMDGKLTRLQKPKRQSMMGGDETAMSGHTPGREANNDFTYDHSYWSFAESDRQFVTQEQVYQDLGSDVINCAFQGYNACIFAYGQTGSGKTFTMMGSRTEPGLIPKICKSMFARMRTERQERGTGYKTNVSYLEIYNERVMDLLGVGDAAGSTTSTGHSLRVREHRTTGPYVEHLSQHSVQNYEEIQEFINKGNVLRTTASTNMNDTSSRSHAIFTITFTQASFVEGMPSETVSKIHLVDLAGSERANATGATGQRLKEGAHINKSLVTLGSVISALAEQTQQNSATNKKSTYIPYRDSVLTWLLKDSLGGNSKTIMIAAISPADCNYSETLSTLRYANRAKNIINKPTINEDPNVRLIRELREEIWKLKGMLSGGGSSGVGDGFEMSSSTNQANYESTMAAQTAAATKMLEDLLKKEAQEKVLTEEWAHKWREAQTILREQKALGLRMSGVGVVLDSEVPHLIGIHDDMNSTGVTLYSLKEGVTTIGADYDDDVARPNIVLSGVGMLPEHCTIRLADGVATLEPHSSGTAHCLLNATPIKGPTKISQGDILVLGRTNMFRYNNPAEAKLRKGTSRSRLDLSRLSLFAASRENLNSSLYCCTDDEISFACPLKHEPAVLEDDGDELQLQDEHKQILETIENALRQMNIERIQMNDHFEMKIQKLSEELSNLETCKLDKLKILNCRERELLVKKEMFLWQKSNAQMQIDIITKQISAIESQLDSTNKTFFDYLSKKVQELQKCGYLNEQNITITAKNPLSDDLCEALIQAAASMPDASEQQIASIINNNKQKIKKLENTIVTKEVLLTESSAKLTRATEQIQQLEHDHFQLILQRRDYENETLNINKIDNFTRKPIDLDIINGNASTETSEVISSSDAAPAAQQQQFPAGMIDSGVCVASTPKSCSADDFDETHLVDLDDEGNEIKSGCSSSHSSSAAHHRRRRRISATVVGTDDDDPITCCCAMRRLRLQIAREKAKLMKNLELNCDKSVLDAGITVLQELQRQYVRFEKDAAGTVGCPTCGGSQPDEEENMMLEHLAESYYMSGSSMYHAPSARSLPSSAEDSEFCISIPNFVMRGAGKKTHYEYEVRINLIGEKWTILRRYSRFRELHLSMKNCYGVAVASIPFPRREFFFQQSETVARNRRRQLETYLRRLLVVCSKIPQSPIYEEAKGPTADGLGLSKLALTEFSTFFKKGLFESGKHGTG